MDASGNVLTRYVYPRGELGPDLLERGGASYALMKDERGSIRFVVDVFSGVVAQALEYDPFGKVTSDTNPAFQPFGFAGGIYDADTGLTHFGAREYDAETGSFTRKDPSGFAGGENRYAYAGGTRSIMRTRMDISLFRSWWARPLEASRVGSSATSMKALVRR